MIKHLQLQRFKSFESSDLKLGPLTLLIGANASGKSNVRDALRFMHGVSRGYTIADILGEKYAEGGVLQWTGIRGGTREATFMGSPTFSIEVEFDVMAGDVPRTGRYGIEVNVGENGQAARVVREFLRYDLGILFESDPPGNPGQPFDEQHVIVRIKPGGKHRRGHVETFINNRPVLAQVLERMTKRKDSNAKEVELFVQSAFEALGSMRFLDLNPESMRRPSFPGQLTLGDRGENLSSVLQAITQDEKRKHALAQWIQELTPLDVTNFKFPSDATGRILAYLVEENKRETSAYSASDGTLRFLAMIAALLGPETAQLYFFEELENGIHPARLSLLVDLIERQVSEGDIQIVATSHSPQLLLFANELTLSNASLVYKLPGRLEARITRILDIPGAEEIIKKQDVSQLFASGWFEDILAFSELEEGDQ